MDKIVLVWNPDINESAVTWSLIRRTKELLDSRGHSVEIVKVPFSLTLHGQLKAGGMIPAMGIKQVLWLGKKFPDATIFQFHTTPDTSEFWRKALVHEKPGRMPLFWGQRERALRGIVGFGNISRSLRMHFIEFPAKYVEAHPNLQKMAQGRMAELHSRWVGKYFERQTSREASEKAGYLSGAVVKAAVEKIEKT